MNTRADYIRAYWFSLTAEERAQFLTNEPAPHIAEIRREIHSILIDAALHPLCALQILEQTTDEELEALAEATLGNVSDIAVAIANYEVGEPNYARPEDRLFHSIRFGGV
jgi:hypothetical protein